MPVHYNGSTETSMMPHVGSQIQTPLPVRDSWHGNIASRRSRASISQLQGDLVTTKQRSSVQVRTSSLTQLVTPEHDVLVVGPVRHSRKLSHELVTPISAVDSVFELPSASMKSPNSSTHSSFVAELEDTSLVTIRSKDLSPPPSPDPIHLPIPAILEYKSSDISARAVIKVVDETIADIEAANRRLLSRAESAEETARLLQEQNSTLQKRIDEYCRPKTAPSAPSPRTTGLRHRPLPIVPTPLSTFNEKVDRLMLQSASPIPSSRPPHYALKSARSASESAKSLSKSPNHESLNDPFASAEIQTRASQQTSRLHGVPTSVAEISGPISGSVLRHEVTLNGVTYKSVDIRAKTISLEEARRRAKPLPPLGPMSPSVLKGVVEIGTPKGMNDLGKEMKFSISMKDGEKKWKGIGTFFRRK